MDATRRPELLQGTLDMLILKTLAHGPNHGYGIARRLKQVTDDCLQVEEGSLYPALHRLNKRGFLDFEWRASESNRRAKYYHLTRSGRAQLESAVAGWTVMARAIERVLAAAPPAAEGGAA